MAEKESSAGQKQKTCDECRDDRPTADDLEFGVLNVENFITCQSLETANDGNIVVNRPYRESYKANDLKRNPKCARSVKEGERARRYRGRFLLGVVEGGYQLRLGGELAIVDIDLPNSKN